MIFFFKQVGLGEALLEAETIEEQESPVNCFRKLFGKKHCILYYLIGVSRVSGIVISGVRLPVQSKGALYIMKFSLAFTCKAFKRKTSCVFFIICYLC